MSFNWVARRVVPSFLCIVSVITPVMGSAPAGATTGSGIGVVDGNYTTMYDTAAGTLVRSYAPMYFYGELSAGGLTYQGGFYIAGLTDVLTGGPGPSIGLPPPIVDNTWSGQDPGVVHAFDPSPGEVDGQCSIQGEVDELTGPAYLVEVDRTLSLSCSLSLLGGAAQTVALTITATSDDVGTFAGTYAES